MRKVILYIAISLDGFIADPAGGVAWLGGEDPAVDDMTGYACFIQNIDTVIMGGTTYRQIAEELSPQAWPYEGLQSYVFTSRPEPQQKEITFLQGDLPAFVRELQTRPGKDIWICGGAQVVSQLLKADGIDVYQLTILPVLMGQGIPLFDGKTAASLPLHLEETNVINGMIEAVYTRRSAPPKA